MRRLNANRGILYLLQLSLHTDKFCKFVHVRRSLINTRTRARSTDRKQKIIRNVEKIFVTKSTTPEVVEIGIERRKRADADLFLFSSGA